MASVVNIRAHAPGSAGARVGHSGNGERDAPDPRRSSTESGQSAGDDRQGIELKSFDIALHPGLHRPPQPAEPTATLRFVARAVVRLVFWSCSTIATGMRAVARRRRQSRNVAKLERLDDVTLKDLGICRCEIEYLARTQGSGKWRA
jgi:uncharacterized protein YjiS (DUF1127 family)